MKVYVFPADVTGCGCYRMIWPSRELQRRGHEVEIILPTERSRMLQARTDVDGRVRDVFYPRDADVIVFQRVTHQLIAEAIPVIRKKGVAVVVDMDDDLARIHPANPAFAALHPNKNKTGEYAHHSWRNVQLACDRATLTTVSTPMLLNRYATHGRGEVVFNYVPERMLKIDHTDSDAIGWGGSIHSHPDDLQEMGSSVAQLVRRGHTFHVAGSGDGVQATLNIPKDGDFTTTGVTHIDDWPKALTTIGIGVAPLADTQFNASKSWLKPLEMCAVGVPWVASPRVEYQRLHKMGAGLLAKNSTAWLRVLRRLVDSPDERAELSMKGRQLAAKLTIEEHAGFYWDAWTRAMELQRELNG